MGYLPHYKLLLSLMEGTFHVIPVDMSHLVIPKKSSTWHLSIVKKYSNVALCLYSQDWNKSILVVNVIKDFIKNDANFRHHIWLCNHVVCHRAIIRDHPPLMWYRASCMPTHQNFLATLLDSTAYKESVGCMPKVLIISITGTLSHRLVS